jgi:hypothetical protein
MLMGLVIKRGFWLVVAIVVSLLWVEAFTRVLLPQNVDSTVDILRADDILGYSYIPGAKKRSRDRSHDVEFKINSLGMRNCEIDIDKGNVFRILVLGNSFSVSTGCEGYDSLPASFERAMKAEFFKELNGRDIQVINAANAGYRTYNYWRGYQKWVDVLNPDAVLVAIVPSRDHITFADDINFIVEDGLVVGSYRDGEEPVKNRKSIVSKTRKKLARNSEFYVLLRNFIYYNEKVEKLTGKKGKDEGVSAMISSYEKPLPEKIGDGWNRSYDYLARIKMDADNDSIPMVVLSIPGKAEVVESYFLDVIRTNIQGVDNYDLKQPTRILREFCKSRNIVMLDPVDALLEENTIDDVYFEHDGHWNQHGIRVACEEIAKQWRELGFSID